MMRAKIMYRHLKVAEKLSVLDRERAALDRANARVTRCANHIDDFNARQAGAQSTPNFDGKNNAR
ncbi:hypothetical protein [Rhizobium binae]|uniref:hypothetical protein n=1 Tax=Rhizobium binae TaxID=1138190 RepID=UPI0014418E46|nr:hypothetical protein [Rhizobium binae]MBX4994862.1 hypothetical protein [Rhizobium binae]QSY85384.1 hypothetical protein J2J99_25535 [Rhizobium binae]